MKKKKKKFEKENCVEGLVIVELQTIHRGLSDMLVKRLMGYSWVNHGRTGQENQRVGDSVIITTKKPLTTLLWLVLLGTYWCPNWH